MKPYPTSSSFSAFCEMKCDQPASCLSLVTMPALLLPETKTNFIIAFCLTDFVFGDRVLLCKSGWPGNYYIEQDGLQFTDIPASCWN